MVFLGRSAHWAAQVSSMAMLAVGHSGFAAAAEPVAAHRPNIIFILADDLGYGDLGCYGQKQIRTPNIDRLAAEGMRFTNCYAGSAVCAPSRTTLMTGLTTGHTTIRNNGNSVLGADQHTVADVMKQAGYHTALIGKWGLASKQGVGAPEQHGFDESLAYLTHTQAHDYTPDTLWKNGQIISVTSGTYAPDLFTSAALEFVGRAGDKPFFLYLAPTFPHANNELAKVNNGNGMEIYSDAPYSNENWPQTEKNKAAMITYLDTEVGQLMTALKAKGLDEKTIVFFTSDNGPHKEGGVKPEFFKSGGQLRGIKRDLYEGGIREPMIVRWPGKVKPGSTSDKAWAFWDFLPTAAELAGAQTPAALDGMSVAGVFLGKSGPEHDFMYWELIDKSKLSSYPGFQQAVRIGNWKVVKRGDGPEVYDLSNDAGETRNLAAEHPELVEKATKLFESARTEQADTKTSGTAVKPKASGDE